VAVGVIQARMSSKRLPGKVLMPLAGKPMIWHIVQRAMQCSNLTAVVVAISKHPSDDPLYEFCVSEGINVFRGSLDNVLERVLEATASFEKSHVVRITGDCPLICPEFIDKQVLAAEKFDCDLVWTPESSLLVGQGVHSRRSLSFILNRSIDPDDLEHVGSRFIARNPNLFRMIGLSLPAYLEGSALRVTVDELSDFEVMSELYTALWKGQPINLDEAISWLLRLGSSSSVQNSEINQLMAYERPKWVSHLIGFSSWSEPTVMNEIVNVV
jgi:spore coat polysaccharide biosynthesis protein SpsF